MSKNTENTTNVTAETEVISMEVVAMNGKQKELTFYNNDLIKHTQQIQKFRDAGNLAILAIAHEFDSMEKDMKSLVNVFLNDYTVGSRLTGVGILTKQEAIDLGAVGPMMRASGIAVDTRKLFTENDVRFRLVAVKIYRKGGKRLLQKRNQAFFLG